MAGHSSSTKFKKGNPGGPGRPKSKNTDYSKILRDALTPQAAFEIVDRAVTDAKQGDARARQWLFAHVCAPIPKTILVNESALESRQDIDSVVSQLDPDQVRALDAILTRREAASE